MNKIAPYLFGIFEDFREFMKRAELRDILPGGRLMVASVTIRVNQPRIRSVAFFDDKRGLDPR